MNIAILTTWNQACGISEHSRTLSNELQKQGHKVTILGNVPYEKLVQEDEENVVRCFEVEIRTNKKFCDYQKIEDIVNNQSDILIVQYENLYNGYFDILFPKIKKPIVVEFHSSCIAHLPWQYISASIVHDQALMGLPGVKLLLPMGILDIPYVQNPNTRRIVSYGLGRNDDNLVKQAVEYFNQCGMKTEFITSYGHHGWKTMDELIKFIQSGDVVCLIYPEVGASVSSSAVNLAFACKRPVITSRTNWFKSVQNDVIQISTKQELIDQLILLFNEGYYYSTWSNRDSIRQERSWNSLVKQHLNLYQSLMK